MEEIEEIAEEQKHVTTTMLVRALTRPLCVSCRTAAAYSRAENQGWTQSPHEFAALFTVCALTQAVGYLVVGIVLVAVL